MSGEPHPLEDPAIPMLLERSGRTVGASNPVTGSSTVPRKEQNKRQVVLQAFSKLRRTVQEIQERPPTLTADLL